MPICRWLPHLLLAVLPVIAQADGAMSPADLAGPDVKAAGTADAPSVAFYYGNDLPYEQLDQFDWVVVEADSVKGRHSSSSSDDSEPEDTASGNAMPQGLKRLAAHGSEVFAYLSVGELEGWRQGVSGDLEAATRGVNADWNSKVADLSDPRWQQHLAQRADALWQQGYRGLFLDTLDSYWRFTDDAAEARVQQQSLVSIIKRIHQRHPEMKLIMNRGFEVLDAVQEDVVGVAAESLYRRWNPKSEHYARVSDEDSEWLADKLQHVTDLGLTAIAIDYVPPAQRKLARKTARRIHDAGFVPWVSVPALNQMGVGLIEPVPRRILAFYDKASAHENDIADTDLFRYLGVILEYMGYAVEYRDINAPLPTDVLKGRYAGIVTWLPSSDSAPIDFDRWLARQMREGTRIAMLGSPAVDFHGEVGALTGLRGYSADGSTSHKEIHHDAMIDFEGMLQGNPKFQGGFNSQREDNISHLELEDNRGNRFSPVMTGDWGGVAVAPWVLSGIGSQSRWIIDPFAFLKTSLNLKPFPMPDATTENGARYWETHIDGDAFISHAEFPGTPFTGKVLYDEVLSKYKVPTTVSVVEGEFGPVSMRPQDGPELEPLARRIFALPWVEAATHTFSHPFSWLQIKEGDLAGEGETAAGFGYNLPLGDYRFDYKREIIGSSDYIEKTLLPPNKKVKMILWSGDALPPEKPLAITREYGLANLNGGNTDITRDNPSLTQMSPMLRPVGDELQVLAAQINENVYTNEMQGPLWGYRRVIETFQLTDEPRRFKSLSIYYHFYSAATPAALRALKQVYDYVLTLDTLPLHTSAWSKVARDWYSVGVARRLEGGWQVTGTRNTRTLRLPREMGWPDLSASQGVAGVRDIKPGRYVALSGGDKAVLITQDTPPNAPYLKHANGRLMAEPVRHDGSLSMTLAADTVDLKVELGATRGCRVTAPGAQATEDGDGTRLNYAGPGPVTIEVACHASD
ncbi:hypothetical protein CDPAHKCJ_01077 [Cobetia sp. MB87]|nr:hypothetical protein [Cobetia sp. MB87]